MLALCVIVLLFEIWKEIIEKEMVESSERKRLIIGLEPKRRKEFNDRKESFEQLNY